MTEPFPLALLPLQTLLETLCSQVTLANRNPSQATFSLSTPQEAQLAYELLLAHGFDVRIYHEVDVSKLYLNLPAAPGSMNDKLEAASQDAAMLDGVLAALPETQPVKIAFTHSAATGKQIVISFPPQNIAAPAAAAPIAAKTRPPEVITAYRHGRKVRMRRRQPEILTSGPALTKESVLASKRRANEDPGLMTWLSTHIFSNFAQSFYMFIALLFIMIAAFSILVLMKGFLCPDLATVKSKAWYCNVRL